MSGIIKVASIADTAAVRQMWEDCFPDGGPAFVDWYFTQSYRNDRTLCMFEGGMLVSNLQMVPYTLRLRGREIMSDTLTGVATDALHRNRGLAKTLMVEALADMARRGIAFTFLYPFDHSFYRRLGWETCSTALEYLKPATDLPAVLPAGWEAKKTVQPDIDILSAIYGQFMAGRNCCAVRAPEQWHRRLGECNSNSGFTLLLYHRGEPAGYAFCEELEGEVDISELAYTTPEAVEALLAALAPLGKSVCWTAPEDDQAYLLGGRWKDRVKLQPHVMFRVTDVPLAFQQAASSCDGGVVFEITSDTMRTENNARYWVKAENGMASAEKTDAEPQFTCGIGTLARILTGFMDAGEARSVGLAIGTDNSVEMLNKMYPKQRNFLFELY